MNRRNFLKTASKTAAGLLLSGNICNAANQEQEIDDLEKYDFIMPRVKFTPLRVPGRGQAPDKWHVRPGGDRNLLRRLSTVIRCKTKPILYVNENNGFVPSIGTDNQFNDIVTFDNRDKIIKYPFLFMTGENEFRFTQNQKDNLRDYIKRGGFLFMEDCVVDHGGDFFFRSAYDILENVFGKSSVKTIPRSHEIFHNVFDLGDIGLPYMQGQPHGARGIFINDRLAILLSSHDIHCGWCDNDCTHFGPVKYEQSIQMGINIIMYSITH
ncbi:MAG: DUF4159 domain-containing protein [Sedimentisphaerales bacterium]|nr:DUF4159 domain-containing protein [Sedimentisphaerales bacterium]